MTLMKKYATINHASQCVLYRKEGAAMDFNFLLPPLWRGDEKCSLDFLGRENLEQLADYWRRQAKWCDGVDEHTAMRKVHLLYDAMRSNRVVSKPMWSVFRADNHFRLGEVVICLPNPHGVLRISTTEPLVGKVVRGYRSNDGCVNVRIVANELGAYAQLDGKIVCYLVTNPEIMNWNDYWYLTRHTEYYRLWSKYSAVPLDHAYMRRTPA